MEIFWTILIGFVVGLLAKALFPGRDPGGFIVTVLIGIAGSAFATVLGRTMGWYQAGETAGFGGAILGAILVLLIFHLVRRDRA